MSPLIFGFAASAEAPALLTEAQTSVFEAIKVHVALHKRGPTLEWLCEATGTRSAGSMHKHVAALERAGFVERGKHGQMTPLTHCKCCGQKLKL